MDHNNNFSSLNELGCVDEMDIRLTKLQGIIGALSGSNDCLDHYILNAALWAARDLISECLAIKDRTADLLPKR